MAERRIAPGPGSRDWLNINSLATPKDTASRNADFPALFLNI
jgi:hypothetical protein